MAAEVMRGVAAYGRVALAQSEATDMGIAQLWPHLSGPKRLPKNLYGQPLV